MFQIVAWFEGDVTCLVKATTLRTKLMVPSRRAPARETNYCTTCHVPLQGPGPPPLAGHRPLVFFPPFLSRTVFLGLQTVMITKTIGFVREIPGRPAVVRSRSRSCHLGVCTVCKAGLSHVVWRTCVCVGPSALYEINTW